MPALYVMGGSVLLQAFAGAQQARVKAMIDRENWRMQEITRAETAANAAWFDTLNHAERWATNKAIAREALSVREKTKFWDNLRHQNAASELSKGMRQAYGNLRGELVSRVGAKSATARALLRSSMQNYYKARENMNVNETLKGRMREQAYQQTLATRDFGFTPAAQFRPGAYVGASPSDAYKMALIQGIAGGVSSVAGAAAKA